MKPTTKPYAILFLVVFLVASCGPVTPFAPATAVSTVTPVFTSTPTETPTPRPTIVPSPTSFLPSSLEYSPPEFGVSAFKLKPWTEGDYTFFIKSMNGNGGELFNSYPTWLPVLDSFYGFEYLLHANRINANDDTLWQIAQMSPWGISLAGMRKNEGYFEFLVEELLNGEKVSLDDLAEVLKSHGFDVTNTISVKDYYGKGEDAFFFDAVDENGYMNFGAVFAVQFLNGSYQVHTIKGWNWMFGLGTGRDYSFKDVVDTNRNGFPELVIEEYEGHSGTPPSDKVTISLNEWNNENKDYRIDSFIIFDERDCRKGACDGKWEVSEPNTKGMPSLIIQTYFPTQKECADLTIQRIYRWDGKTYPLEESMILPPVSKEEECQITWAETAIRNQERGWQNDQAIHILSAEINNWPETMDKDWGPASRDYFRLRLGIWKDLRGEDEEALKLLTPLAQSPFMPDYPLPSQAAKAYLSERKTNGLINACQNANETWSSAIERKFPDPWGYIDIDTVRNLLGFASDLWGYGIYEFSSVCSEDDAIFTTSGSLQNTASPNPASWFTRAGRSIYLAHQDDFNMDGLRDWLIIAKNSKGSRFSSAWFFFGSSNHYEILEFDDSFDSVPPTMWRKIQPDQESQPIYLLHIGNVLWVFRVGTNRQIESLVDDYGITSLQIDQSKGLRLKASVENGDYKGSKIKDYAWDSPSQTFLSSIEEYDFVSAQQKVEQMIFQERDFSSAISFIQQFIAESPHEYLSTSSCDPDGCEYYPETYYPYMYYMMGLAYEMSGQPVQAARIYYLLWKNYPDSPYALMAQNKLELVEP